MWKHMKKNKYCLQNSLSPPLNVFKSHNAPLRNFYEAKVKKKNKQCVIKSASFT